MATLHQASLSVSVFQQHLLTLCLCHILVTRALFQMFSLLWYCYGIFDLCCCCNCLGAPWTILYIAAAAKSLHLCLTLWPRRWQPIRLPQSLGFSRQEHWSGLPFPSPMHESEKCKWSRSVVSDPSQSHGLKPPKLLRPWYFPGKCTGVGCHFLLPYYILTTLIDKCML